MDPGFLLSGRYRIEELIGRGSQSSVYRATDEVLGREVAVKLFRDGAQWTKNGPAGKATKCGSWQGWPTTPS